MRLLRWADRRGFLRSVRLALTLLITIFRGARENTGKVTDHY